MSAKVIKNWVKSYLRAALEVDSRKMPWRIVDAREAVAERLKSLEGNSDHHAERHEMQSALTALTCLEDDVRIWPMAATSLMPEGTKPQGMAGIAKRASRLRKAAQPPPSHPEATADSDRAKKPSLVTPPTTGEQLNTKDRVEDLGNFADPTAEVGTVESTNENEAMVKCDDDVHARVGQPWLKKVSGRD